MASPPTLIDLSEYEQHPPPPTLIDLSSISPTSSPDSQHSMIGIQQLAPPIQEPPILVLSCESPLIQEPPILVLSSESPPIKEPPILVLSSESDYESPACSWEGNRAANTLEVEGNEVESFAAQFDMVMTRAMAGMGKQTANEKATQKMPATKNVRDGVKGAASTEFMGKQPTHEKATQKMPATKNVRDGVKGAASTEFQVTWHGDNWEERMYGKKPSGHFIKQYVCLFPACDKAYARLEFFNHHRILEHPGASMVPNSKRGRLTRFMQSPSGPKKSAKLDIKQYAKRCGMVVKATVKMELLLQRACQEHVDYYVAKKDTFIHNYVRTGLMVKGVAGHSNYPIIDNCTQYDGCCFCRSSDIGLEFEEKNDPGINGQEHISISSNTSENNFQMKESLHGMGSDKGSCSDEQLANLSDGSPIRSQETTIGSSDRTSDLAEQQVHVVGSDIIIEASDPLRHKHTMHGRASSQITNSMTRRRQRRVI